MQLFFQEFLVHQVRSFAFVEINHVDIRGHERMWHLDSAAFFVRVAPAGDCAFVASVKTEALFSGSTNFQLKFLKFC